MNLQLIFLLAAGLLNGDARGGGEQVAAYRATLATPGGELPFRLEIVTFGDTRKGWVGNGSQRLPLSSVTWRDGRLGLAFDYYDSVVEAEGVGGDLLPGGLPARLEGRWRKRAGRDKWAELNFSAEPDRGPRFAPLPPSHPEPARPLTSIAGRWLVRFEKSEDPAIGVFRTGNGADVEGTFLTTTGDYGFLGGTFEQGRLRLSGFDGAHAFLFDARLQDDGTLRGDFWSRDAWHETWTAKRDENAALPDSFGMTRWSGGTGLDALKFPDLTGRVRSLDDPEFRGKARIIEVFGSWCPNCFDASRYLAELDLKYRERGLRIVGLAFELTGDFRRDAAQVRKFTAATGADYPVLVAGINEKDAASKALPMLDRLRGYPTTILMGADGTVRAVHTGFSGPATGEDYDKLRREFEAIVEELLAQNGGSRAGP